MCISGVGHCRRLIHSSLLLPLALAHAGPGGQGEECRVSATSSVFLNDCQLFAMGDLWSLEERTKDMGYKWYRTSFWSILFPSIHQVCPTPISVLSGEHRSTHVGVCGSVGHGGSDHRALARRRRGQHIGKFGSVVLHCHVWISSLLLEDGDSDEIGPFHSPSLYDCHVSELRLLVSRGNLSNEGRKGIYSQCVGIVLWVGASGPQVDLWQWRKSTGE